MSFKEKIIGDIETHNLPNGVLLRTVQDFRTPEFEISIILRSGSKHELFYGNKTGVAHFLEHACFWGSMHYKKEEFSDLKNICGSLNAGTDLNVTEYVGSSLIGHEKELVSKMFSLVYCPLLEEENIQPEKNIILNERSSLINNRNRYAWDVRQNNLTDPRFHHDIVGRKDDIESMTREDLVNFHEIGYVTENTIVIVNSSLDHKYVKTLIAEAFRFIEEENPKVLTGRRYLDFDSTSVPYYEEEKEFKGHIFEVSCPVDLYSHKEHRTLVFLVDSLSGWGVGSIFDTELREKNNLCYNSYASVQKTNEDEFSLQSVVLMDNYDDMDKAKDIIFDILNNFESYFSRSDFEYAVKMRIKHFIISLSGIRSLKDHTNRALCNDVYELPWETMDVIANEISYDDVINLSKKLTKRNIIKVKGTVE